MRAGLCSAHVDGQKWWNWTAEGTLEKFEKESLEGEKKCLTIDASTDLAVVTRCGNDRIFLKVNVRPYSHDLYK